MTKNIRKMYTSIAKKLITVTVYVFLSLFILARGTLKFLSIVTRWQELMQLRSELQVMESKSLVVIDCLRRESVSKLA